MAQTRAAAMVPMGLEMLWGRRPRNALLPYHDAVLEQPATSKNWRDIHRFPFEQLAEVVPLIVILSRGDGRDVARATAPGASCSRAKGVFQPEQIAGSQARASLITSFTP
jgi:hypothetical protein